MIIFYNLKEDTVKEIENFIKDRESKVAVFTSDSITEVKKVIKVENKSVLVFRKGNLKRDEIEGIKQKLEGTKSIFFHFVEIDENDIEKAKIMVLAKLRRLNNSKIHSLGLKPAQKVVLGGKVSRREMLDIFSKLVKPRYEVIPYVSASNFCKSCGICISSCPFNAICIETKKAHIDKDKCKGCGVCVNSCPANAIIFPTMEGIDVEVETLLEESSEPIIEFYCKKDAKNIFDSSSNFLQIEVPCVWACSLLTMLKSFLLAEVCLLRCGKDCKYYNYNNYHSNFNFINFIERISGGKYKKNILKEKSLKKLILKLKQEFEIKGIIEDVPFGFVNLNKEKCTVCGLCAENCPRNALIINNSAESVNISFDNPSCNGCGLCKKICPENAVEIKKILDFDNLNVSLIKDEYKRCSSCNEVIAPLSLYNKINKKVGIKTNNLEYCPVCRIMNQIK